MEAQKLKKKKCAISKGKIKKTIKNVICRPDPEFWPTVTENEKNNLEIALKKHRVHIPEFKKQHWNVLKLIPKKERPQPPQIPRVQGLIFGISECCNAVKNQSCTAVLIEANVNPQAIARSIIESCTTSNTSVLCIKDLRQLSLTNFGIKTSCLGVKKDYLHKLNDEIQEIYLNYKPENKTVLISASVSTTCKKNENLINKKEDLSMDVDVYCPYVYRTDKKTRVFVPNTEDVAKVSSKFIGQHYIKIAENKPENESKAYMRMILKKITNNPSRVKVK